MLVELNEKYRDIAVSIAKKIKENQMLEFDVVLIESPKLWRETFSMRLVSDGDELYIDSDFTKHSIIKGDL